MLACQNLHENFGLMVAMNKKWLHYQVRDKLLLRYYNASCREVAYLHIILWQSIKTTNVTLMVLLEKN